MILDWFADLLRVAFPPHIKLPPFRQTQDAKDVRRGESQRVMSVWAQRGQK